MSWSFSGVVSDGDTSKIEENFAANAVSESAAAQRAFALNMIKEAFDSGVVDGAYSLSVSGHSDPDTEGDRKSFSLSFSPVAAAVVMQPAAGAEVAVSSDVTGPVQSAVPQAPQEPAPVETPAPTETPNGPTPAV